MIVVEKDKYRFQFSNAINAFPFDEQLPYKPFFHGAPMKAVDVLAEFELYDIYIEIKDYLDGKKSGPQDYEFRADILRYKFRDTFLYRFAEGKILKPVKYFILTDLTTPQIRANFSNFNTSLPVGIPATVAKRWKREIASECRILNLDNWNRRFPNWQINRI